MASDLLNEIRLHGDVPHHVAIIMDGNGRWARRRGLPRQAGHAQGMKSVREATEGCVDAGVRILTLFAFSTENWQRPRAEVSALMALLQRYARKEEESLRRQGVEVHVLGELDRVDPATKAAVNQIVTNTRGGDRLRLNLMISYSGREEILRATRALAARAAAGELDPATIDESVFQQSLFTGDLPDPDLLIRTSGEFRLSNFLLWQMAYTELHITSVLWPDFNRESLFQAVQDYQRRERRFGRVIAP